MKNEQGLITYKVTVSLAGVEKANFGYFPALLALSAIDMAEMTESGKEYAKFPHACWLARRVYAAANGSV